VSKHQSGAENIKLRDSRRWRLEPGGWRGVPLPLSPLISNAELVFTGTCFIVLRQMSAFRCPRQGFAFTELLRYFLSGEVGCRCFVRFSEWMSQGAGAGRHRSSKVSPSFKQRVAVSICLSGVLLLQLLSLVS